VVRGAAGCTEPRRYRALPPPLCPRSVRFTRTNSLLYHTISQMPSFLQSLSLSLCFSAVTCVCSPYYVLLCSESLQRLCARE
jgi:hypothetical protein